MVVNFSEWNFFWIHVIHALMVAYVLAFELSLKGRLLSMGKVFNTCGPNLCVGIYVLAYATTHLNNII